MLSIFVVTAVSAQVVDRQGPVKRTNDRSENLKPVTNPVADASKLILWSNECNVESDWSYANTSNPAQDWYWTTNVNNVPAAGPVTMTTAANGFFAIDSDAAGNSATQDATITYNNAITTIAGYPTVVLEFEHHYRTYLDTRTVEFSTDGGVTWPHIITVTDGTEANTNGGGTYQVNVSAMIGGAASVMIRFRYVGNWGWHWAVDDIRIIEQPADDVQLITAWVAGENNEGTEYGRYPVDQMDDNWFVGAEVFNFGANDQTSVDLYADFTSWNSTSSNPLVLADETVFMETLESPALSVGLYEGMYELESANDLVGGPQGGNNTAQRNFEVNDLYYSQDGIGVHPVAELQSLGTDSWTDGSGEDGFVLAAWYHIKQPMQVGAIEVALANGTVAGGELFVSIIDTAELFANSTAPLHQSQIYSVTAADVAAGKKTVWFDNLVTLNPGCYFAAVELYSMAGSSPIRILDDITVTQPFWSSVIFIPNDQTYTNGEAWAIRLRKSSASLDEEAMAGISVYPNPSEGVITVTNNNGFNNSIEVIDVTGKVVETKTVETETSFDLSAHGAGVYMVKISNDHGSKVERVVIK